jgi:glycosyltransferase involved in cell wall biosynthesis
MSEPLPISVVIPAYNAEDEIRETLASVLAQTRPPFEIIVVDDGSSDRTAEVARSSEGVTVVSQTNAGVAAARNRGIGLASQPWIALLDADDHWLPEKLALQWEALEATGARLCATDFSFVHPNGERSMGALDTNRGYRRVVEERATPGVVHLARDTVALAVPTGMFLLPSTLVFARQLVTKDETWFLERAALGETPYYNLPEDAEWVLRMLRNTDVALVKRVLVEYRVLIGSLSCNAGRMRFGDVKLGELVCARPENYASGCAGELQRLRRSRFREATTQFLRQLDFGGAFVVAREAYRYRRGPGEAALLVFARAMDWAPARFLARAARALWRGGFKVVALRLFPAR